MKGHFLWRFPAAGVLRPMQVNGAGIHLGHPRAEGVAFGPVERIQPEVELKKT